MKVTVQEVVDAINDLSIAVLELSTPDDEFNLDYRAMRTRYKALTERIQTHGIAVEYTPMTDDEILAIYSKWFVGEYGYAPHTISSFAWESAFEQAVLARLGVAPTLDQAKAVCEREGLAVVPNEPTAEMIYDFMAIGLRHAEYTQAPTVSEIGQGYKAMLEAARIKNE